MNNIHVATIAITGRALIPHDAFKKNFPSSLESLGTQLAQQVHDCVVEKGIGYYPPLDFMHEQDCVETFLLDAVDQVSSYAQEVSDREILSLLQPVFSNVSIESLKLVAYTMPSVRLGQNNALKRLSEHYTPDTIQFQIRVSMIQKKEPEAGLEKAAENMVVRWLNELFSGINITSSNLV